jgi:hypothetical protein
VPKPYAGGFVLPRPSRTRDEAECRSIETLRRHGPCLVQGSKACEGRLGEGSVQVGIACPGRENPKGASSHARAKTFGAWQGTLREGQNPEVEVRASRPLLRQGNIQRTNGMWAHRRGNAAATSLEEKAPKGQSHERCRYETEPARMRRE